MQGPKYKIQTVWSGLYRTFQGKSVRYSSIFEAVSHIWVNKKELEKVQPLNKTKIAMNNQNFDYFIAIFLFEASFFPSLFF